MPDINLGRIGFVPRGDYQPDTVYRPLDAVRHNNHLWACLAATASPPSDGNASWSLLLRGTPEGSLDALGGTTALRGPNGELKVGAAVTGDDAANKTYVDGRLGTEPYTLPDGELNLYVNGTVGDDSNDGMANSVGRAFATLDRAFAWVRERAFHGTGSISIRVADGNYYQTLPNGDASATFYDAADVSGVVVRHLLNADVGEPFRVRVIGNLSAPQNVVYNFRDDQLSYALLNAHVYGVTFRGGGPAVLRHSFMYQGGELTNCRYVMKSGNGGVNFFFVPLGDRIGVFTGTHEAVFEDAQTLHSFFHLNQSTMNIGAHKVTLTGAPVAMNAVFTITGALTISVSFAYCYGPSLLQLINGVSEATSITGANVTGKRYQVEYPSKISTGGKGANAFPGTVAGVATMPAAMYS